MIPSWPVHRGFLGQRTRFSSPVVSPCFCGLVPFFRGLVPFFRGLVPSSVARSLLPWALSFFRGLVPFSVALPSSVGLAASSVAVHFICRTSSSNASSAKIFFNWLVTLPYRQMRPPPLNTCSGSMLRSILQPRTNANCFLRVSSLVSVYSINICIPRYRHIKIHCLLYCFMFPGASN